jgi:hypothetical protein
MLKMEKKLVVLLGILVLMIAGCYNANSKVELTLQNETAGNVSPVDGGLLEQIHEVAEEIQSGETNTTDTKDLPVLSVNETDLVNLKIQASDADKDTIKYTFSEPLDADGTWQTKYGDSGEYIVTITASDAELSTSKKILLTVMKKNEAPVIADLPSSIDADEGDTIKLEPVVSDVNSDNVTVTISAPIGDDGIWETDHTSAGKYDVTITATDGQKTVTKEIKLTVADKNEAPSIEVPSEINIKEGQTLKLEPVVADLDGDNITVTIGEPVGNDGIWETGFTDNGEYDVVVRATDGKDTTEKSVKLVVEDVNKAPEILDITLG